MKNLFINNKYLIVIIIGIDVVLLLVLIGVIVKFSYSGAKPSQNFSQNIGKFSTPGRAQNTYTDVVNKITFKYPSDWKTKLSSGILNFNAPNSVTGPYMSTIPTNSFGYGLSSSFGYPSNIQGFLKWINSTYSSSITNGSVTTNKIVTVGKNTHIVETIGSVNVYETTLTNPDLGYVSVYFFDSPSGNVVVFSNIVGEQKNLGILPEVIKSMKFI